MVCRERCIHRIMKTCVLLCGKYKYTLKREQIILVPTALPAGCQRREGRNLTMKKRIVAPGLQCIHPVGFYAPFINAVILY